MSNYFEEMDKFLAPNEQNKSINPNAEDKLLSKPIIPISRLGATFGELQPGGGQQAILRNMIASIRKGSGTLQLALMTSHVGGMMTGISSVTKEQRQAIKEVIQVSGLKWQGLELSPHHMQNVTGFDHEQGGFSERKRQEHLKAIKEAIDFNTEIGAGGGVDIFSQEYQRDITTADFNQKDKTKFIDFTGYDENKDGHKYLVDKRTGKIMPISTGSLGGSQGSFSVPIWEKAKENTVGPNGVPIQKGDYIDSQGNKLDPKDTESFIRNRVPLWNEEKGTIETKKVDWPEFKKFADQRNKESGLNLTPEEWAVRMQLENQYAQHKAQIGYHTSGYEQELRQLRNIDKIFQRKLEEEKLEKRNETMQNLEYLQKSKEQELSKAKDESEKNKIEEQFKQAQNQIQENFKKEVEFLPQRLEEEKKYIIINLKRKINHAQDSASQSEAQAQNIWDTMQNIERVEKFGKEKVSKSYAELGIYAMEQTEKKKPLTPIHVGPELGFPTAYGGHPKEFIELIQNARKEMVQQMKNDPRYRSKFTDKQMEEKAKEHIAGEFDTAHLNMWYNHFPKENPNESEENKLKRFNKWYLQQVEDMAKAQVIGGVQVVDTLTGDHRHLPAGQGVFPIAEAIKVLEKNGYKGQYASEGHEEEINDPGSTQYSLWNLTGASIGNSYHFGNGGGGNAFNNIYGGINGAAGYRMPPGYVFGAYSPSEQFKLWSEVPLE